MSKELLTVDEVAALLRCHPTTVRKWIKDGTLAALALPHRFNRRSYRIRRTTLDDLFDTTPEPDNGNQSTRRLQQAAGYAQ